MYEYAYSYIFAQNSCRKCSTVEQWVLYEVR